MIVAIKASYEQQQQHGSVDALIDSVNACPVQTANRALTGEEVQLRTLWIEAVYLMLHHVNHPRSNKTDDDSDTTSPLYNVNNDTARRWDDKEKAKTDVPTVANGVNSNNAICDCSVFIPILPRLVDLHQEQKQQQQQHQSGEKKGGQLPKHVTLELIRQLTAMGNLPPATTTMDKDMAIAVLSQTIQVMWYTLVVLDEEQYANSSSDINVKPKAPSSS